MASEPTPSPSGAPGHSPAAGPTPSPSGVPGQWRSQYSAPHPAGGVGVSPTAPSSPPTGGPGGPDYIVVARAADLPPGALKRVAYGDEPVVLANIGGQVRALADTCLHRGASLAEGRIRGGHVVCPWHAWTYDPSSGRPVMPRSATLCLATYPVRVEGDVIVLGPRAAAGGSARDHD